MIIINLKVMKMKTIFKCPYCSDGIIREDDNGTVIRNKIIKTNKSNTITSVLCPRCGKEVLVPVQIKISLN